jgi:hypothetical protein
VGEEGDEYTRLGDDCAQREIALCAVHLAHRSAGGLCGDSAFRHGAGLSHAPWLICDGSGLVRALAMNPLVQNYLFGQV